MKLVTEWQKVCQKAWSVRLALISAMLSGVEFALPYFAPESPSGWFAAASMACSVAAGIARIVAQPKLYK